MNAVHEPARRTPLLGEADLVVLGGGPAGLAAAVAGARRGARTVLVERYGFLGGMGTAGGVTNFAGLYGRRHGEMQGLVRGVVDELLARERQLELAGPDRDSIGDFGADPGVEQSEDAARRAEIRDRRRADCRFSVVRELTPDAVGVLGAEDVALEVELGARKVEAMTRLDVVGQLRVGDADTRQAIRDVAVHVARLKQAAHLEPEASIDRLHEEAVVPTGRESAVLERRARRAVGKDVGHDGTDLGGALLGEPRLAVRLPEFRDLGRQRPIRRLELLNALDEFGGARTVIGARGAGKAECCKHQRREQRTRGPDETAN